MDLKMEVYSPFLELLGLLEIQNSVMWENKAFSSGSFTLNSLITEESKTLLVPENIIWIAGDDAGIIEYVQQEVGENGPYITVKGCNLTGLLSRRILWGRYGLSGPVPEIMYRLVDDCCINPTRGAVESRKIPGLVLAGTAPTGGPSIQTQKTGGYLLDALEELGTAYGVSFGVRFNPAVPCMEFWTRYGVNRAINQNAVEPVFYSTELDDVLSSEYSYNAQNWRNVALVAGEGEGKDRVMVTVNGGTEPSPTPPIPPSPTYTIRLSVDPEGGGLASGGGTVSEGQSITVTAAAAEGYNFTGWQEDGQIVSGDAEYTFTVTGNRELTAAFVVKSRLPEGYTEVEYISTGGYARLPTGIRATIDTTRFVLDCMPTEHRAVRGYFFDSLNVQSNYSYSFSLRNNETDGSMTWFSGYWGNSSAGYASISHSFKYGERVIIDMDSVAKKLRIGNSTYSLSPATGTTVKDAGELNFGGYYPEDNVSYTQRMNIYSAQVYLKGELKGDFVPCTDKNGEVGMFNLVNNTFYKASHGTITPGPAV